MGKAFADGDYRAAVTPSGAAVGDRNSKEAESVRWLFSGGVCCLRKCLCEGVLEYYYWVVYIETVGGSAEREV